MSNVSGLYDDLHFHVRRSIKYHDHRKRFFENVLNWSIFIALVGGVAFIALSLYPADTSSGGSSVDLTRLLPGLITSLATSFALLSRASAKANLHNQIKTNFIRLRQEMERGRTDCTEEQIAEWRAQRLGIEVDEPPINRVVDAICHNEVTQSMGNEDARAYVRVLFRHRLVGIFTRHFDVSLRKYREGEKGPAVLSR